jgi:hypothetical protein
VIARLRRWAVGAATTREIAESVEQRMRPLEIRLAALEAELAEVRALVDGDHPAAVEAFAARYTEVINLERTFAL